MFQWLSDRFNPRTQPQDMEEDKDIPQNLPLCPEQVMNNAGGFGWKVDDMNRLRRFLCLGCEGGTYYTTERDLAIENAMCIQRLIEEGKGEKVVEEINEFSTEGRAAKQEPAIFALAMCARLSKDEKTKRAAYNRLPAVCRIPTHLFNFVEYSEKLSRGTGWGRAHRRAISGWYNQFNKSPKRLAMHVTKYRNRNGWAHKDLLRLSHLKPETEGVGAVVRYVVKGIDLSKEFYLKEEASDDTWKVFEFLDAVEKVKTMTDEQAVIELVAKHGLVREHIPTNLLNSETIWRSLLEKMPMTAMIRNLGKMSSLGLFNEQGAELKTVTNNLTNQDLLKKAKIHPFNVLVALNTYKSGKGEKGSLTWPVNDEIVQALNTAFYMSFKNVEPTGKRYCLALDVSGSMGVPVNGARSISAKAASAAMTMVTMRTEPNHEVVAFSDKLVDLAIDASMKLEEVLHEMTRLPFGGTNCSAPMVWAREKKKLFDVFVVYTDCETWSGNIHPAEALRQYRRDLGVWDAKLIVVGMSSSGFTIADPDDPGMLDMVGFDSAAPSVMREFILGML